MATPATWFARSGDLNIAYQAVGTGPEDLVFVPGIITHVELAWEENHWATFLEKLASFSRLILFDRRGAGMSDRVHEPASLEQRTDDVRAVLDAVGSERAALFGTGDAAATFALFAAMHPDRVSALVLFGMQPRWRRSADYPWGMDEEQVRRWVEDPERRFADPSLMRNMVATLAPSIAGDEQIVAWLARTWRLAGATPASVAMFRRMNVDIDVRRVLPTISVPTLVLQRARDAFVPAAVGRYTASQIPEAQYVELPGTDWLPWFGDADGVVDAVRTFVERVWRERPWEHAEPERVLATIVFTDLVDSTAMAVSVGDHAWAGLLAQHRAMVRTQLARFRGREIDTAGDGFFATFDGPARAIRYAREVAARSAGLGLAVRAGVHTGECEVIDGKLGGVAVHIGARVASLADAGEVLVTGTVRDLVAGSDIAFTDKGSQELRGVPGTWALFAVEAV